MPTYGFRCPNGHEFDKFYRKMSDAVAELPCTTCGEPAQRQLHGGAGLLFKGSGFYLTDYGKNAHRKSGDARSGEGKAGGEGKSSGGDAKPASGGGSSSGGSSSGGGSAGGSSGGGSTSGSGGA